MIGLFDGTGLEYRGKIETSSSNRVKVSILGSKPSSTESPVGITIGQALLKGRKMDDLLRQLTELGIIRWIPFIADRSVARLGNDRQSVRMNRWQTIVKEAAKQCKRGTITKIDPVIHFEDMLGMKSQFDFGIVFYEGSVRSLQHTSMAMNRPVRSILVVIGPEGGFTEKEIEKAESRGFEILGLGPRILKSETATIAACSVLQFLFGDMG